MQQDIGKVFLSNKKFDQMKNSQLENFLADLKPGQMAIELFSLLPEIMFWVKDAQSSIIFCNEAYSDSVGIPIEEIIGKTDAELFAPELAMVFLEDDKKVISSGNSVRNKLELVPQKLAGVQWRQTSKMPLLDSNGSVKGTVGMSRVLMSGKKLPAPYRTVKRLVEYVESNIDKQITVKSLCDHFIVSQSTLERRFKDYLGCSPKKFITKSKMAKACELLSDSPMTIGEIAGSLGYENQASFTRLFAAELHMTPSKYRDENNENKED